MNSELSSSDKCNPAILSLIEERWIQQAFDNHFSQGKDILYFVTESVGIGPVESLNVNYVYFKLKGKKHISLKAKFVGLTKDNPVKYRLAGCEAETAKYYYGFEKPKWLKSNVEVANLRYYNTKRKLPMTVPGACIIVDPEID